MDEMQIAKDALKKGYLKEIATQLCKVGNLKEDSIDIDEEGKMRLPRAPSGEADKIYGLVRFLANEIANLKAELWLQSQSNKELRVSFQNSKKNDVEATTTI